MVEQSDSENFWQLWHQNHIAFSKQCLYLTHGNKDEAEEILSQGMLKMAEFYDKNRENIKNFNAWAKSVIYHNYIDICRQKKKIVYKSPEWFDEGSGSQIDENLPELSLFRKIDYNIVLSSLMSLPPCLRLIFIMRRYKQKNYREIAKKLNLSQANTRKRMQKAKELFQKKIKLISKQIHNRKRIHLLSLGEFIQELEKLADS